jgi:hypothetical protein
MSRGRHSLHTTVQREKLWHRCKAGETILGIAQTLSQGRDNLYRVLEATGGIAPVADGVVPLEFSVSACARRSHAALPQVKHFAPLRGRLTGRRSPIQGIPPQDAAAGRINPRDSFSGVGLKTVFA